MYQLDKKEFGAFVASLRKEKGYTQKELAARLCLSDKAVSKWETGVSIPDTPMLVPLAQALDVTVTELLLCRRQIPGETLDKEAVEEVVQQAIQYPAKERKRAYTHLGPWGWIFPAAALVGAAGTGLHVWLALPLYHLSTPLILGGVFGLYFCFFAPLRLPDYYDQHRISGFMDGPVRMNMMGLSFNNRNWPHILRVCRIWSCADLAGFPFLHIGLRLLFPALSEWAFLYLILAVTLGGLLLPLYLVGKKYES